MTAAAIVDTQLGLMDVAWFVRGVGWGRTSCSGEHVAGDINPRVTRTTIQLRRVYARGERLVSSIVVYHEPPWAPCMG